MHVLLLGRGTIICLYKDITRHVHCDTLGQHTCYFEQNCDIRQLIVWTYNVHIGSICTSLFSSCGWDKSVEEHSPMLAGRICTAVSIKPFIPPHFEHLKLHSTTCRCMWVCLIAALAVNERMSKEQGNWEKFDSIWQAFFGLTHKGSNPHGWILEMQCYFVWSSSQHSLANFKNKITHPLTKVEISRTIWRALSHKPMPMWCHAHPSCVPGSHLVACSTC